MPMCFWYGINVLTAIGTCCHFPRAGVQSSLFEGIDSSFPAADLLENTGNLGAGWGSKTWI